MTNQIVDFRVMCDVTSTFDVVVSLHEGANFAPDRRLLRERSTCINGGSK